MPKKAAATAVREQARRLPLQHRMAHLDMHSPHLTTLAITSANENTKPMAKAMLANADPHLTAALDFLLETYASMALPRAQAKAIHDHLAENTTMTKARKWMSGEGFGLVSHVAQEHTASLLDEHGGSMKGFKKFLKGLGHVIEAPFKFLGKAVSSGSKVVGQVAQNLAPVADIAGNLASKIPPGAAMALV